MEHKDLTDEQKAKARACSTPEEMLALAQEEGYELSDEELEGVAGGWGCSSHHDPCEEHDASTILQNCRGMGGS